MGRREHDFSPHGLALQRCNLGDYEQLLREGCALAIRFRKHPSFEEPAHYEHFVTYEHGRGFVSEARPDTYAPSIYELLEWSFSSYDPMLVTYIELVPAEEVA